MSSHAKQDASSDLRNGIQVGLVAGAVASVVMGMVAMGASFLADEGVFTPLHRIATLFVEPTGMLESLASAEAIEGAWEISIGAAVLGLVIHLMTGAMYGALFGVVVAVLKLTGPGLLELAGIAWGGVVMVISGFVALPAAAWLLRVGDLEEGTQGGTNPIGDMAEMTGWGAFAIEHLVFGLLVGLVFAGTRRRAI